MCEADRRLGSGYYLAMDLRCHAARYVIEVVEGAEK
jgi:hypothetical protein